MNDSKMECTPQKRLRVKPLRAEAEKKEFGSRLKKRSSLRANLSVVVARRWHLGHQGVDCPDIPGASVPFNASVQRNLVVVGSRARLVAFLGHKTQRYEEFALVILPRGSDDGQ